MQILKELDMAPESHRDFGWLKEVILMAVDNPLDWKIQYAEYIGKRENITRERVRQIKEKSIRRLRQSSRSKLLKSYLG